MAVDELAPGPPARAVAPGSSPARPARVSHRLSTTLCLLAVLLTSAASLALKSGVPTFLNLSPYDGLLFARNATSLAQGDWLGHFTNLTLVKGIGYPALMTIAHAAGAELAQAEQVVYLVAAVTVAGLVLAVTRRRWLATGCFVFLALGPANFGAASNDVVRDNLYASLALLFVASAALLALAVLRRARIIWIVAAGLLCGLSGAWAWVTREEGLSLLPPVLAVVVGFGLLAWTARRRTDAAGGRRPRWSAALRPLIAVVAAATAFAAPLVTVAAVNDDRYGVALTDDMGAGTFLRAYADWTRVEVLREQRRIPINAAQRRAVYAVSPAARELAASLERSDNPWRSEACRNGLCEYGGGWMVWAIRDAAADAGHFDDARDAQAYFARLAQEIDDACAQGELTCRPRLPAGLQPIQRAPLGDLVGSYLGMTGDLLLSRDLFEPVEVQTDVPHRTRAEYTAIIRGLPASNVAAAHEGARYRDRLWQYDALGAFYRGALLVLLAGTVLGGIAIAVVRRRRPSAVRSRRPVTPLAVFVAALVVGILVRLGLLAIVDVAEYDAANGRYQLTDHVFLLAAVTVGAAGLLAAVMDRRRPDSARGAVGGVDQAHREADDGDLRATDDQHHAEDR